MGLSPGDICRLGFRVVGLDERDLVDGCGVCVDDRFAWGGLARGDVGEGRRCGVRAPGEFCEEFVVGFGSGQRCWVCVCYF